jgi:hypothetical protein
MALAEQYRSAQGHMQRVQEMVQLAPLVAQDLATVKSFESQLSQFNKAVENAGGWIQLATSDPLEWPKYQAQYQQLVNGYQTAVGALQHKSGELQQRQQMVSQENLGREYQKLTQLIPEWSDQAKYQTGAQEVHSYLVKQGADPQAVASLSDALAVSIARKAMLYDKLKDAKKSKQLRAAPPVIKPGSNAPSDQGRTRDQRALSAIRTAGRQGNTHAQEKALEGLLGKVWKS